MRFLRALLRRLQLRQGDKEVERARRPRAAEVELHPPEHRVARAAEREAQEDRTRR